MLALTQAAQFQAILSDIRILLEVVAGGFAVRAYRHNRTTWLGLLRAGFLCLAVTEVGLLFFAGLKMFVSPKLSRFDWIFWANPVAVIAFLVLSILSFDSLLKDRNANGTKDV
ncbi:MAG: hypothetical protein QOG67_590 [Verrucomicrobiota bacterium]|jgi:hypothetical protein